MGKLQMGLAAAGAAAAVITARRWFGRARKRAAAPPDNPAAFVRAGKPAGTTAVVVCAGDSLTHALVSASYLERLRGRFAGRGWSFVNAGINGNLAWNVAQRLDAVIACQPDAVTLLIGTNDVLATLSGKNERRYRRGQGIRETPTLDWYQSNVTTIIDRLRAETAARIAVLSLPMIGEDLGSEPNRRVGRYNAALRAIAAARQVAYLLLHETLAAALPARTPPAYRGRRFLVFKALFQHRALHMPWDAISAANGLTFLTDHVHLNERGAAVIADLIGGFLEESLGQGQAVA
ncbi:MAG TPA: GDSL-type esterase/lipase family protein [Herpetosiphonaceae bacterium]|nr:GDSL-type esterase/lipase family protein [Herpetosiphonaceae bacterium]